MTARLIRHHYRHHQHWHRRRPVSAVPSRTSTYQPAASNRTRLKQNGKDITLAARQVILSAGALQSPILLMRSGVGPAAHLVEHGIPVQAARPGVGENLHEHPLVAIIGFRGSRANPLGSMSDRWMAGYKVDSR